MGWSCVRCGGVARAACPRGRGIITPSFVMDSPPRRRVIHPFAAPADVPAMLVLLVLRSLEARLAVRHAVADVAVRVNRRQQEHGTRSAPALEPLRRDEHEGLPHRRLRWPRMLPALGRVAVDVHDYAPFIVTMNHRRTRAVCPSSSASRLAYCAQLYSATRSVDLSPAWPRAGAMSPPAASARPHRLGEPGVPARASVGCTAAAGAAPRGATTSWQHLPRQH